MPIVQILITMGKKTALTMGLQFFREGELRPNESAVRKPVETNNNIVLVVSAKC